MIRCNVARARALAAALLLLAGACAGDDSPTTPTTTASTTGATTATTTAAGPASSAIPVPAVTTTAGDGARLVEVVYAGGQVAGGAQRRSVQIGEKVRLRIESDVADEVHVHTYDLRAAVAPGQPAVIDLVTSIPGRHEVELEKKRKQLLVLEVR